MENRMSTDTNPQAALYAALAKAQGEFLPLAKNRSVKITMKSGGSYNFRYADLEAVLACTRPALAANGLAVVQMINPSPGANFSNLTTTLAHKDGGTIESAIQLPPSSGGDIKNYGATISYLRRYAYSSLLCVAADDDLDENGEEAGAVEHQQHKYQPPQRHQPAQSAGDSLPCYPEDKFLANVELWDNAIRAGKTTPERIIMMVSSKAQLSKEQTEAIHALATKNEGEGQ